VDKFHFLLIPYFVLVYSWMYRVALRTLMDGANFRWVNLLNTQLMGEERRAFIAGNGTDGHFIVIVAFAMFSASILFLIIRRPDGFTKALLLGWIAIFGIHQFTVAAQLGTDYVIRGDSIGMVLPFYILGPLQHVVMLTLALWWVWRNSSTKMHYPNLTRARCKFIWCLLAIYPLLFILFRFGEQDGLTDKLGIICLYLQTTLIIFSLYHFEEREVENA
jgi:hypothetical protein